MEKLLQDIRYTFRTMVRSPGLVTVAVVSLALGAGPNIMIFSLVNALLLRPLLIDKPEQVMRVFRIDDSGPYHALSYQDYLDYKARQQVFTELAAGQRMMVSLNVDGRPEAVLGAVVSANFFSVLGAAPSLGRAFAPEEDQFPGGNGIAVISHNLWKRRFNADPALPGRTLKLNGHSFTIIGVAAPGFSGIDSVFTSDVWVPLTLYPKLTSSGAQAFDPVHGREEAWLNDVIGRLKPGVSIDQAKASLNLISAQLESAYPSRRTNQRRGVALVPVSQGDPEMRTVIISFTGLLMAVVGLVLLIACANVANLLLTRAAARQREIAIRLAMGANRWRLVRQLLTESLALALAGGAVGLLLAYWANDLLLVFKPPFPIPLTLDLGLDWRVLVFSVAISFLTGIVFGLAPALRASRSDLVTTLKIRTISFGRGPRGGRIHSLLVMAQMALSVVLLVGASLLIRSMRSASQADPGFEKKQLVLLSTDLDLRGYTAAEGRQFYRRLIDQVSSLPGLHSVSLTSLFPLSLASSEATVAMEGRESERGAAALVGVTNVGPRYFETMNIPLIQGREFNDHDTETGPRVAIINQTMAQNFWAGVNPIGKRIKVAPLDPEGRSYEIIGVVKDSKFGTLAESPRPFMHLCLLQEYSSSITLVARAESNPEGVLAAMRHEVELLDGDLPIFDAKTITKHMGGALFPLKMATTLLGLLGAFALVLASVGLYAVMAYSVTLRTRDFGIRMALGASSIQVIKSVLTHGAGLAMIGTAVGLILSLAIARAMSSLGLLYGISAIDPVTFFGVPLLLISVAALACYLPARRATKINPVIALRQE